MTEHMYLLRAQCIHKVHMYMPTQTHVQLLHCCAAALLRCCIDALMHCYSGH